MTVVDNDGGKDGKGDGDKAFSSEGRGDIAKMGRRMDE